MFSYIIYLFGYQSGSKKKFEDFIFVILVFCYIHVNVHLFVLLCPFSSKSRNLLIQERKVIYMSCSYTLIICNICDVCEYVCMLYVCVCEHMAALLVIME